MWAKAKFNFQFLLRLDDDFFVCMDRLVNELPSRPKTNLSWGWYHCEKNNAWMDEGWALFSEDVIEKFLSQDPRSMLCHPFADQQFSLWIKETKLKLTEFNDRRIHHHPPAESIKKFFSMQSVCDKYIGLHGTYPKLMPYLWRNSNDGPKHITGLTLHRDTCHRGFNMKKFPGIFKHEPKPCIDGIQWGSIVWRGRGD